MSETARAPFVRPRFLKASLVVFVLLVPFVVHAAWDYVESRRFARLVAAVRAAKEPTSVYEAKRAGLVRGEAADAARYYRAAAVLATRDEGERAVRPAAAEALSFLDRAAPLRFETFPAGTDYSYLTYELIMVGTLARDRTRALADRGDGDGAAASLYTQARLLRALEQSVASLMQAGSLADDAGYLLSRTQPGPASLARLASAFTDLDRDDTLRKALLRERGSLLDRGTRDASWLTRPLVLKRLNDRLENLRALLAIAARPWPRRLDLPADGYVTSHNGARATTVRTMDENSLRMAARQTAAVRAARIAIAAAQYRASHKAWPPDVAALVPQYLPAVPIDPYRAEPMRSLVEDDGSFVAYSVGLNDRDDRGLLAPGAGQVPVGRSRADAKGDIGVRITAR